MAKKPNEGAGGEGSTQSPDPSTSSTPGPQATESAAALESLFKENEQLRQENAAALQTIKDTVSRLNDREAEIVRLTGIQEASRVAAQAQRERHDAPLLRVLKRASEKAQKSGDARTHQALEQVIVTLAEARHRVKEATKIAKGEGLHLLEDLEELLD